MNFLFLLEEQYPEIEARLINWLDKHVETYHELKSNNNKKGEKTVENGRNI